MLFLTLQELLVLTMRISPSIVIKFLQHTCSISCGTRLTPEGHEYGKEHSPSIVKHLSKLQGPERENTVIPCIECEG
jgi:hypothetical protein